MDTDTVPDQESQPHPIGPLAPGEDQQRTIYVIATTLRATSHALDVASALAHEHGKNVAVLVSSPERITITSARAHVYNLPVELPAAPGTATLEAVRNLVTTAHRDTAVRVTAARDARGFARILPQSASVVLAGPIHHFVETPPQCLARKLTALGYDVVFLPCADE
jgi:hypothetical protein